MCDYLIQLTAILDEITHKGAVIYRSMAGQFEREETELLVLRVMVGLVILYDHIHPQGAFVRSSPVDVKGCVRILREQAPIKSEPLLNALR